MAIQEVLNGTVEGTQVNATATVSEFSVEMTNGIGRVTLEYLTPGSTKWVSIATNINNGSVSTPDPDCIYRFRSTNVINAKVYFGP